MELKRTTKNLRKTKRTALEKPANRQFGENLRIYRKSRGMTLLKMAGAIGLTYQQLQKYETGQNRLKLDTVIDIAEFFGIEPLDMFSILLSNGDDIVNAKALLSEEALKLVSLYDSISDEKIRRNLTTLLKGMAGAS